MPIHKDQRVGVFVDIQNMYYSAKQFYNSKVNFGHILNKAVAGRKLIRAIAYVIKADIKEEENFFEALEKLGYEVKSKDLQVFFGGAKKGDWDVGIAMDIMRMASKLDVVVLVSGDGDFKDLIEHVKALGCRAEVIAFGKTASSRIISQADEFIDLDRDLDRVLIKDKFYEQKQIRKEIKQIADDKKEKFSKEKSFKQPLLTKKEYKEKHSHYNENNEQDKISFLQKINMEQPILKTEYPEEKKGLEEKETLSKKPIQKENLETKKFEFVEPKREIKFEFVEPEKEEKKICDKSNIEKVDEKKEIKKKDKSKEEKNIKESKKKKKGILDNVFSKISKKN
ncbi:MAG: NYN domain-containing protein [Candidatus Woesearchaeota archaeon]